MPQYDDIDTRMAAAVGIVTVLLVIGSIVGIQALYNNFAQAERQQKVIAVEAVNVRNLQAEQEAKLNRAGWVDRDKGVVAIPIERAMELIVKELREDTESRDVATKAVEQEAPRDEAAKGRVGAEAHKENQL